MKLNTNSNSYIIIYSAILVVVVAFLLAFVYKALKPMQDANVELDKKKQILAALNVHNLSDEEAEIKYNEMVLADYVIDENAQCEDIPEDSLLAGYGNTEHGFKLNSSDYKAGRLALYICKVGDKYVYVVPVYGMGLWGPIWGYVGISYNKVYGAYFDHESETAGLGAEIKDSQAWQEKFIGKEVLDEPTGLIEVCLGVKKPSNIKLPNSEVDCITGATLTSDGVDAMLKESIAKYRNHMLHTPDF